jgi:lipid II:glycine glycyltransferase (peptidoglycan interpeptide bridge formation enzyme)
MATVDHQAWCKFITQHSKAHFMQSGEWGVLKSEFGWDANYVVVGDSGALVLFRKLPLGLKLAYIPKGPVGEDWEGLLPEVDAICRSHRAVFLKIEPDAWDRGRAGDRLKPFGFRPGFHSLQTRCTMLLDIHDEEDNILAQMKQKTRYNIRLASRKGVTVCPSTNIQTFMQMMKTTGKRDGFNVRSLAYYQRAFDLFYSVGKCELLVASFEDQPLAALMVFAQGERAYYLYGASSNSHRNRMPTYLLQWEAIRWAKKKGCNQYDLWGIPDEDVGTLEAQFSKRSDGLWGVYRFKRGFGGQTKRSEQAWDLVYNPTLYAVYRWLWAIKQRIMN